MTQRFHTIVTTVENKPGVLARVSGLFARRGYNIESLAVAPTNDDRFSRITFTVDLASDNLEQVVKQLNKLINVVEIHELDPARSIERELMLVVVTAALPLRHKLLRIVSRYGADVLDENYSEVMLMLSAKPSELDEFEESLSSYGIVKLQRTGRVAMHYLDQIELGQSETTSI
ncbi:MAG: acetolactate synthase small subunit [Acidimicrobiaceae bacterium]|nr:acetolactate synthase small subunit [Acidimicrobiaceae bacterium]